MCYCNLYYINKIFDTHKNNRFYLVKYSYFIFSLYPTTSHVLKETNITLWEILGNCTNATMQYQESDQHLIYNAVFVGKSYIQLEIWVLFYFWETILYVGIE